MANKTQREFRKQMKQLEKEGKVPESYYPRRRMRYGYSISACILIGLVVLWRFGILHSIYYTVMYRFVSPPQAPYNDYYDNYNDEAQLANEAVYDPINSLSSIAYAKSVTLNAERYFIENQSVEKSSFEKSQQVLDLLNSNLPENHGDLSEYQSNVLLLFKTSTAINNFALQYYDTPLTAEQKNNLQSLIKTVKDVSFSLDALPIPQ